MKTRNILGILAIVGLGYYLLSRKKQPAKEIGQMADAQDKPTPVGSLANILMPTKVLTVEDIKVPAKEPLYIQPNNAIPNVYDRGVGLPVASLSANGKDSYFNNSGVCSENIQQSCKCATMPTKTKFKADIPTLP